MNYVIFDVEYPNDRNDRMSAIGISLIKNGRITDDLYSLVDPETSFDNMDLRVTGIVGKSLMIAPTFPDLWKKIEKYMDEGILVSHNALYDLGVLKNCLNHYGIKWKKSVDYLCTLEIGRELVPDIGSDLSDICSRCNAALIHRNAASDSRACAELLLRYKESGVDIESFIKTYDLTD